MAGLPHISRIMAWLALLGVIVLPLAVIVTFLDPDHFGYLNLRLDHLGARLDGSVPLAQRFIALFCKLTPVGIAIWGLLSLRRVFRLYARGAVFSPATLASLANAAFALVGYVIVNFAMEAPISAALSWGAHGRVTLSIGLDDIATIFLAGTAFVIARVMGEAHRIADENAGFV